MAVAPEILADELVALLGTGRQVPPFSERHPGFGAETAAEVAAAVHARRTSRGERPVGRKIGFTNTTIWHLYGIDRPIWGHVYDTTLHDPAPPVFAPTGLPEPRIEPEIVLRLGRAPASAMDDAELLACVDRIAHGFEIVASVFPGWRFTAADCTAGFGLHGALLVGPQRDIAADRAAWGAALAGFRVTLSRDGAPVDEGHARNVLGGPLAALRHLVETLAAERTPPLAAGELVSTGTLTDAFPVHTGETWSTELHGLDLPGLRLKIA